jgi:hypothetical protein
MSKFTSIASRLSGIISKISSSVDNLKIHNTFDVARDTSRHTKAPDGMTVQSDAHITTMTTDTESGTDTTEDRQRSKQALDVLLARGLINETEYQRRLKAIFEDGV